MAKRKICQAMAVVLALGMCTTGLTGCGNEKRADGKTEIEVVSYKPEAVKAFEKIEKHKCAARHHSGGIWRHAGRRYAVLGISGASPELP